MLAGKARGKRQIDPFLPIYRSTLPRNAYFSWQTLNCQIVPGFALLPVTVYTTSRSQQFPDLPARKSAPCSGVSVAAKIPYLIPELNNQRLAKGAGGKGPRQKTSKIVKKCQNYFRHFSTIFARHQFSGPF